MGEATRCAQDVVAELVAQGVREVVLAPGSRSAPLAYAVVAADQDGQLRMHVRIDERGAGFLALGLAKVSGQPVAVVTTSGTAVANLHPAVLEAWHAHLPLVVVTADRPRSMTHTGANQTTHQLGLFGDHLRGLAGLSDAVLDPRTWRFEVSRLLAAARGVRTRLPGPVHLNVELSDPLTPELSDPLTPELSDPLTPELSDPLTPEGPVPAAATGVLTAVTGLAEPVPTLLTGRPRTVVLAGDGLPDAGARVAELATSAGVPLLAEPSSNARRGPVALATYRLLLDTPLAQRIERVVVFGHPTLSRPITRLLAREDVELVVVSPHADWIDPGQRASMVLDAVRFGPGPEQGGWLAEWQRLDRELGRRLADLLAAQRGLSGPLVARTFLAAVGEQGPVFVGASNPVRDLDLAPVVDAPGAVYANRGLSGIDGSISTAAGIALGSGRPVHALLGDVTTLHDLTGLAHGPDEPRPNLRIVVANDDGGSIFATLEHGAPERELAFERVFATPHGVRFAGVAEVFGVAYAHVTTADQLRDALGPEPRGVEIVEVVVDRRGRRALDRAVTGLAATL